MSGTREGALKSVKTIKEKYGDSYYADMGRKGGSAATTKPKGFAYDIEKTKMWSRKGVLAKKAKKS